MLEMNLEFVRGMLFVRLEGELNENTYTKLSDCLDEMIYKNGLKYFVINLENVNQIDESGIQTIINRYFDIILHDGKMVVCGYHHQIKNNLELKNIFDQIEKSGNELGALKLIHI